jgi:hypothetical protein
LGYNINFPSRVKIDELFNSRNKLVHFFGDNLELKDKSEVISNQLVAWYVIYHNYIIGDWKSIYSKYLDEISALNDKLRKHKKYLKIIFDELSVSINRKKMTGIEFIKCPVCGYLSYEKHSFYYSEFYDCLVCGFNDFYYITCSTCGEVQPITECKDDEFSCVKCHSSMSIEKILEEYKDNNPLTKDNYWEGYPIAHCGECGNTECVIVLKSDLWFCLCCKTCFSDEEVGHCDYCNDLNAGDLDGSALHGCSACFGSEG